MFKKKKLNNGEKAELLEITKEYRELSAQSFGGQGLFHGGCVGCEKAESGDLEECPSCQYFEADWDLPDLNSRHVKIKNLKGQIRNILT